MDLQVHEVHASFMDNLPCRRVLCMAASCKEKFKNMLSPCIVEVISSCDFKVRIIFMQY